MEKIRKNIRKDRSFGLILGVICLGFLTNQFLRSSTVNYFMVVAGLGFFSIALVCPVLLLPLRKLMEWIGHYLGIANTYILLTLIYVLLFIPIGLILKITGKDNLNRKWDPTTQTYWSAKPTGISSMKNQF